MVYIHRLLDCKCAVWCTYIGYWTVGVLCGVHIYVGYWTVGVLYGVHT